MISEKYHNRRHLGSRAYSQEDQHAFADLSGDHNPLHVNRSVARRTLAGGLAVHGIHQVFSAFELLLAYLESQGSDEGAIAGFNAQFLKMVLVGERVDFHLEKMEKREHRIVVRRSIEVVSRITIKMGNRQDRIDANLGPVLKRVPAELALKTICTQAGCFDLGLESDRAWKMFPRTMDMMGNVRMASTLGLSRLIGIHCPGLNSIFAEANIQFCRDTNPQAINYRVEQVDARFGRIEMAVRNVSLQGKLIAFMRPPPQAQPAMAEVVNVVQRDSFTRSIALIVGGTRGLGEITAKIIAAGGGLPIISYFQGDEDAERVRSEINCQGGRCAVIPLDVRDFSSEAVLELMGRQKGVKTCYYFATPKIEKGMRGLLNPDLLQKYREIYVICFERLISAMSQNSSQKMRIFYPSTGLINSKSDEFKEYILAKECGEELSKKLNKLRDMEIMVERLPLMKTDQTQAILSLDAQDSLEVMLPLVKRMESMD